MRKFYVHAPGMVHAITVEAADENEAKNKLREFLGVKRLPSDSAVWRA